MQVTRQNLGPLLQVQLLVSCISQTPRAIQIACWCISDASGQGKYTVSVPWIRDEFWNLANSNNVSTLNIEIKSLARINYLPPEHVPEKWDHFERKAGAFQLPTINFLGGYVVSLTNSMLDPKVQGHLSKIVYRKSTLAKIAHENLPSQKGKVPLPTILC